MLQNLFFFALAYYFKKNDQKLGLKFLLNQLDHSFIPDDFHNWFLENKNDLISVIKKWSEDQIQVTYPSCWDYPEVFLDKLDDPPLLLFYKGTPIWKNKNCISVVGSRKMTEQSKKWIESELYLFLKYSKSVLVSGGAIGIDQESHLQSLRLSLPTIVVIPSGLSNVYPQVLGSWMTSVISKGGVFLSEYFPDQEMRTFHFVQRNRLIAALGNSVLIIQGEKRSGTLMTAKLALKIGQPLGVLPAHPSDQMCSGNLEVMRWGGSVISDHKDLQILNQ